LRAQVKELGERIAPYYVTVGVVDTPPDTSGFAFEIPRRMALGGTVFYTNGCTRSANLFAYWLYPNFVYYQSEYWVATMAHEWAHVCQGPWCSNWNAEVSADLIGYAVLAEAGEYDGLVEGLFHEFTKAVITQAAIEGIDRERFLDTLNLSEKEYAYYNSLSDEELIQGGKVYWLALTTALVTDTDGYFEVAAPHSPLDGRALWTFVNEQKEWVYVR
jgi:hypothetical protein